MQLCFDLIETWLPKNPDAVSLKKDGQSIFKDLALFQDYHGLPEFKKVSDLIFLLHISNKRYSTLDASYLIWFICP